MYRDETNPEASRFCVKPSGYRITGHKHGVKAFIDEGIFVHENNTKRKSNCFHKPRGSIALLEKHRAALLTADTTSLAASLRRTFWANAFEGLKWIEDTATGIEYLNHIYDEFSPSKSESLSSEEEEDEYVEQGSQGSTPIETKQIDLDLERPRSN